MSFGSFGSFVYFLITSEAGDSAFSPNIERELADTDFASVQNFVKLGLYLKK